MNKSDPCLECEGFVGDGSEDSDTCTRICDEHNDWLKLTAAEVITPEEKAEFNAYCEAGQTEQVKRMYAALSKDCLREIHILADYVNTTNDAPTYANVGDLNAVFEKLVNINGALGLYDDYAPG